MRKFPLLIGLAILAVAGCSKEDEGAAAGTAAKPQIGSAEQLPQDMDPNAKASAAGAMGAAGMQQQMASDPARLRAMQEMNKQRR